MAIKYYEIVEPFSATDSTPVFTILSEQEILDDVAVITSLIYWERFGKLPSRQDVLSDWIAVHWADQI